MRMPGPWAMPLGERASTAARQAPLAYAFVLAHPVPTLAFTLWAIDGLLHCDDAERVTCHLGFAIHLLFPAAVGMIVAVVMGILGLMIRPSRRSRAWLWLLLPTIFTWLTLWLILANTAEPGPAPWYDPPITNRDSLHL